MIWVVFIIICAGVSLDTPEFFIIAGIIATMSIVNEMTQAALKVEKETSIPCARHKWTKSIDNETYCEVCKKRPVDL
jgi:hypothetical protein